MAFLLKLNFKRNNNLFLAASRPFRVTFKTDADEAIAVIAGAMGHMDEQVLILPTFHKQLFLQKCLAQLFSTHSLAS